MTIEGEYSASPTQWVRDHVDQVQTTGDTTTVEGPAGKPIVVLTMLGATSGKVRKVPLMRVEHNGDYLAVASKGGAPQNPQWFHNLVANPDLDLQDGTDTKAYRARMIDDPTERQTWWDRAVESYPPYAEYQQNTDRQIPLFVLERRVPHSEADSQPDQMPDEPTGAPGQ